MNFKLIQQTVLKQETISDYLLITVWAWEEDFL